MRQLRRYLTLSVVSFKINSLLVHLMDFSVCTGQCGYLTSPLGFPKLLNSGGLWAQWLLCLPTKLSFVSVEQRSLIAQNLMIRAFLYFFLQKIELAAQKEFKGNAFLTPVEASATKTFMGVRRIAPTYVPRLELSVIIRNEHKMGDLG